MKVILETRHAHYIMFVLYMSKMLIQFSIEFVSVVSVQYTNN